MLRVAEAEHGIEPGSIAIFAEVGEKPEFFLSATSLRGHLGAAEGDLIFDGAALVQATASQADQRQQPRGPAHRLLFARAATVLKARQAGLPCYELLAGEA